MLKNHKIQTLFLDVGGVLMTNGWDHSQREKAAVHFGLDWQDFERRHALVFDLYETGKLSLEDYLKQTVFWKSRPFTSQQFQDFMMAQSQLYPDAIQFFASLKKEHGLKIAVVSNEGRELTDHRIRLGHLTHFVDAFFVSCFVHVQKPHLEIFNMALDIMQTPIEHIIYIDDRLPLIEAAAKRGIRGIHHTSLKTTQEALMDRIH